VLEEVSPADAQMDALWKEIWLEDGFQKAFHDIWQVITWIAAVYQVYTVSNISGVKQSLYSVAATTRVQEWIVDSGASTNMRGEEKFLSNCETMKAVTVTVTNDDRLPATSTGSPTFHGVQGTVYFTRLLYVPRLHKSLI